MPLYPSIPINLTMSSLTNDEVRIEVKRKELEPAPRTCLFAAGGVAPKLKLIDTTLVYKSKVYHLGKATEVKVEPGDEVTVRALIKNETGDGNTHIASLIAAYTEGDKVWVLGQSEKRQLGDGITDLFSTSFHMGGERLRVIGEAIYHKGWTGGLCLMDTSDPIFITPLEETVEVLGTARNDAGKWVVGAQLCLDPGIECASANDGRHYYCNYQIVVKPEAGDGGKEALVKTETGKSKLHVLVSNCEMKGEAVLWWDQESGTELEVELWRYDMRTEEDTLVEVQTIYLGKGKGMFQVSVSDSFFDSPYIWWWNERQTVHCYECTLGYVPGIFLPVSVPNVLIPPIKKVVTQGEVAEFTSADGLEEGKIYVFGIEFFHAVDQAVNGLIYEFHDGIQEVHLVPVPGVGNSICPLLGVDPKSYECTLELAEFADPIYVANSLRKIVDHKDIAGNTAEPDKLDYIFLPIALLSGLVPAGTMGKKLAGPILKNTKPLSTVDTWVKENWIKIQAAVIRSDDLGGEVALARIDEAAKAVEGSEDQKALLEEAGRILDDLIGDSKHTYPEVVKKQKLFEGKITKSLDDVHSKTPADKVIEESGLHDATKYVPRLGKVDFDEMARFKEAARKGGALDDVIESLGRLQKELVEAGDMPKTRKALYIRIFEWTKRHHIATGAIVGIAFCLWWWSMDNLQFIIALLRRTGILDDVWGDQWDDYERDVTSLYYKIKDDPCDSVYQQSYVHLLMRLRNLIDSADPIPESKIARARYLFNVLYGRDVGDPNERVLEDAVLVYDTARHWYYELTMGCSSPLVPEWVKDEYDEIKFEYIVKVQRVADGDTFDISALDPDWPFDDAESVRVLGADTPDPVKDGYNNILGYEVRRKSIPEKDAPEDLGTAVLKEEFTAATNFTKDRIDHQFVTIRIDPLNIRGKYGRLLATVTVDNEYLQGDLGEALLKNGHAMLFFYSPNALMDSVAREGYVAAEAIARNAKLGVWSGAGEALPTGKIKCASTPNGVYIYLDDKTMSEGVADKTIDNVTIGRHTVELKGLTYRNVYCKDCRCGYTVDVTEGETETVECTVSAVYEIKTPYWEDEEGIRWHKPDEARVYVDDGTLRSYTGLKAPCTLEFGKDYTGLNEFTIKKIGSGSNEREVDHGEWRISVELDGYKTIAETVTMGPGIFKSVIPILDKGPSGDVVPPEPTPPPGPPSGQGTLYIGHAFDINTGEQISTGANKFPLYALISGTKCDCRCYIPETLSFGDDEFCNSKDNRCPLPLGTHTFVVERKGYEDFSFTETINDGDAIDAPKIEMEKSTVSGASYFDPERNPSGLFIEYSDTFIASVTNTGGITTSYNIRYNFYGMSENAIGKLFTFTSDIWSDPVAPNETIELSTIIGIPAGAIPMHVETARYGIRIELQGAAVL